MAFATAFEALPVEGIGDGRDVIIKAPLRDERACQQSEERKSNDARQQPHHQILQHQNGQDARHQQRGKREQPVEASPALGHARPIEAAFQAIQQCAHPYDGMLDAAEESDRIAESCLDQQCAKNDDDVE